jgi:hypothetical protein
VLLRRYSWQHLPTGKKRACNLYRCKKRLLAIYVYVREVLPRTSRFWDYTHGHADTAQRFYVITQCSVAVRTRMATPTSRPPCLYSSVAATSALMAVLRVCWSLLAIQNLPSLPASPRNHLTTTHSLLQHTSIYVHVFWLSATQCFLHSHSQ